MKYKTKLLIGFSTLLLMMFTLLAIISNVLASMNANVNEIVDDRYIKLKLANALQNNVNNVSRLVANVVMDDEVENTQGDMEGLAKALTMSTNSLANLQNAIQGEQGRKLLEELSVQFDSYKLKVKEVMEKVKTGKKEEAADLVNQELRRGRDELLASLGEVKDLQEKLLDEAYLRSKQQYEFIRMLSTNFMIIGLLAGIVVAYWVIKSMSRSLNTITSVISSSDIESTEGYHRIPIKTADEIGNIAKAFNEMLDSLEEHSRQEKEYKQAMKEHSWLKTQVAEITSLCQGVQDVQLLAQMLISKITPLVGASYGVFFTKEGNQDSQRLVKSGFYAQDGQEIRIKYIEFGEGLVGQCAVENNPLYLLEVPSTYIQIGSSLGHASPAALIILPIPYEGQVLAVLELASFQPFTPLQRNLLEEISGILGAIFNSLFQHVQVRNLLRESQTLTEELQSQSEELRLQQEELRSINEKLEEQYKNSESKAKELETVKEELEKNAVQIQQASRYKSEFLANMSHELRTPLNSLLILAQILKENKERNLTAKQVEYASTIVLSGNNLLNLINDILDLTKVESGKMTINMAEVPLKQISEFAERNFNLVAAQKFLEFNVKIGHNLPEKIETDEQRIQQILTNLLSNAFKFTTQGSVELGIVLRETPGGSMIAFQVKDTGSGIPAEKQEIIFEAFQQADGTTSRKYGGTGLGLAISREMANLLGGFIQVESEEGKGSTFTLYLPLEQTEQHTVDPYFMAPAAATVPETAEEAPETQEYESLQGKKVLVVDDDMRNIFALTAWLEERKMNVFFAENGRDGISVLQENPDIDIVLMDIMMPEMDGYEAIETIRSFPAFEHLPIIALTAKAMKNDREKCMEAGASDYISKPVNLDQLLSLMRVWLYS